MVENKIWIYVVVAVGLLILTVFVARIIKVMLKIEKKYNEKEKTSEISENSSKANQDDAKQLNEFNENLSNDVTGKEDLKDVDFKLDNFNMPNNANAMDDWVDEDFFDYSKHVRNRQPTRIENKREFDFEDDDFEYTPSSPDMNFLSRHARAEKKKDLPTTLNDLPDELKVLMISDLFNTKF